VLAFLADVLKPAALKLATQPAAQPDAQPAVQLTAQHAVQRLEENSNEGPVRARLGADGVLTYRRVPTRDFSHRVYFMSEVRTGSKWRMSDPEQARECDELVTDVRAFCEEGSIECDDSPAATRTS